MIGGRSVIALKKRFSEWNKVIYFIYFTKYDFMIFNYVKKIQKCRQTKNTKIALFHMTGANRAFCVQNVLSLIFTVLHLEKTYY